MKSKFKSVGWKLTRNASAIVVLILTVVASSQAQSFSAPVEYPVGSPVYAVAAGDFNGDGKPDLASANNSTKTVSVLLGNGGSSFNSKTDYAVGASPYSIVAVDLNKDGKLDLVTANSFSLTNNLSVLLGNGDGTFASRVDYVSSGLRPSSLVPADLNGDGNPDLVVNSDSGVFVFIGNGDGTLKPGVAYSADLNSYSLAVADFNQDNKLDLAVSSYGNTSGRVSILLGKGDGTFLPAVNYTAGPNPISIAAGDFNGDGKIDLVTANTFGTVSILLGQGDGTFQALVSYATPTFFSPYYITTADLNNDGKLDVLVAGNSFGLCALKGNGDGTFRPPVFFTTGGVFATLADLNADGKPDVISADQLSMIGVYLNQTGPFRISGTVKDSNGAAMNAVNVALDGGAEVATSVDSSGGYSFEDLAVGGNYTVKPSRQNYVFSPVSQSFSNISSNLVADFTGTLQNYSITGTIRDSFSNPMANVTVALSGGQTGSVATIADGTYAFSNLPGGGNYTITPSYPKFVFSQPSRTVTNLSNNQVINFSGSLPTFIISGAINDANNGSGISPLPVLLTGTRSGSTFTSSQGYSFSNLPVDGNYTISAYSASGNTLFTNLLMLSPATQSVSGLSANTTVNFSARRLNSSLNSLNPVGIAQGDLNGDGKPDLVAASSTGGFMHVLIGNGDGTFKPDVSYAMPSNAFDVAVGDFDRDGKLDVASCGGGVSVLLGNGDGTLKTRVDYAVPGSAGAVRTADVNLDGKLDLLVLSSGNNLSILLGNGDGTFAAAKTKSYPNAIGSIVIGDFNSDNKPDLVTTAFPGSVFLFAGNGDGTFADPVSFPAGNEVRQASAADLNGDGKLDLVVGNFRGFTVLLGNGNGTFQAPVTTSLTQELLGSVVRDFDGDGKLDLAIVNASGGVMFSLGNGDGTFNSPTFYGPGSYSVALVTADFNGDGKPDLAFTNNGGPDVTVLLNASLTRLPSVQFAAASVTVNEGAGNALVTITRTTGLTGAAQVSFATSDQAGTQSCATVNQKASSRCDYTPMSGTLDFAPGELSKTISIPILDDSFVEGNESFTVSLTGAAGASLGTPSQITVNIVDNDVAPAANPVDQPPFFVTEHYYDFLNRQPDTDGLAFWTGQIASCGPDAACIDVKRINVSAAFFLSIEFQQTGYLVERFYKTAFGDATGTSTLGSSHQLAVPTVRLTEFLQDTQRIGRGVVVLAPGWEQALESNKQAYAGEFVQTTRFLTTLPTTLSPGQFVDRLNQNAGNVLSPSERTTAINLFVGASDSSNATARAQALRMIAEDQDLYNAEFNRAFVLAQYFGYLRRNPNDPQDTDYTGYEFWLNKLNQFNGDYIAAEMVKAFISSNEYRQRFGP